MFNFLKQPTEVSLSKDQIAKMLQTDPKALETFESAYQAQVMAEEKPGDMFHTNTKQAAKETADIPDPGPLVDDVIILSTMVQDSIVTELLAQTEVYWFDGDLTHPAGPVSRIALPGPAKPVSVETANALPMPLRPQLTGTAMCMDISNADSSSSLLYMYSIWADETKSAQERQWAYNHFLQGLDILDLDPLTYAMLGMNPNSMSHWLPALVNACMGQTYFKIPATRIAKVPMTLLQMTRLQYETLTPATKRVLNQWALKAFELDTKQDYFIKTGTFSSKFDFRNAHVHGEKEVRELGEYLCYIQYQAQQMAGSLCSRPTYGVSTTNEWVVREFIRDVENNPTIYKGLPLHTEYRVFVDCDKKQVIGFSPYWEPETMLNRFGHEEDAGNPHQVHDYIIYKAHEDTLMDRYYTNIDMVLENVERILPKLALKGQWSVDIMQNGKDFYIIDMALAEQSAFYETVPEACRSPRKENWLPDISQPALFGKVLN